MVGYRGTGTKQTHVASFRAALFGAHAPEHGLLLPEAAPPVAVPLLREASWLRRATAVMQAWVAGEVAQDAVASLCRNAFHFQVPVRPLGDDVFLAELFHGPTAAFKDVGAQFMANAMELLRDRQRPLTVLVATSGDTGSAVAHAFSGTDARVVLLYPAGRVSPLQELQLTAVPENAFSVCVDGTFDDCQSMVRSVLADTDTVRELGLVS